MLIYQWLTPFLSAKIIFFNTNTHHQFPFFFLLTEDRYASLKDDTIFVKNISLSYPIFDAHWISTKAYDDGPSHFSRRLARTFLRSVYS